MIKMRGNRFAMEMVRGRRQGSDYINKVRIATRGEDFKIIIYVSGLFFNPVKVSEI
jgi:hypothetical protein